MAASIRIGVDARMDKPWLTGLGRYARSLAHALTALPSPDLRFVIIKHPLLADVRLSAEGSDAEEVVVPGDLDTPRNLLQARSLNALHLDLYHALENFVPPGLRVPAVVVTTHDLVWVEQPELVGKGHLDVLYTPLLRAFATATMTHAFRRARALIAVSEATRRAALTRFPFLDPGRVHTIHHGVDRTAFPRRQGPEPDDPTLLLLGNSQPNKNLPLAFKALALLHDARVRLVVAGRGDRFRDLQSLAHKLHIDNRVQFLKKPNDIQILQLMHDARALVFPSLVEGFGLPLIEAMSAGCPILASSVPVVREICGEAALFFDPRDPSDLASAMQKLLASADLRDDLRRRGDERALAFTWPRAAGRTLSVYRSVLASSGSPVAA